jgi:hypothetical protein
VNWQDDKQRHKDIAGMRLALEEALAARKRAALRVLDVNGTWAEAAQAGGASPETVKKWAAEANHPRAAERRKT